MRIIKPISDLRNKSALISGLAHSSDEPVFIANNGEVDLVVMSIDNYTNLEAKVNLLSKLSVAQNQKASGDRGKPLNRVMVNIKISINTKNKY